MRKHTLDLPLFLSSESFPANSSEESSFPSGAKMQSQLPFGTFARMSSASFDNPCKICVSFGFSGSRTSGNSSSVKSQNAPSRVFYSSEACI